MTTVTDGLNSFEYSKLVELSSKQDAGQNCTSYYWRISFYDRAAKKRKKWEVQDNFKTKESALTNALEFQRKNEVEVFERLRKKGAEDRTRTTETTDMESFSQELCAPAMSNR
jgi:uncharacterized protein (DUF342 family)